MENLTTEQVSVYNGKTKTVFIWSPLCVNVCFCSRHEAACQDEITSIYVSDQKDSLFPAYRFMAPSLFPPVSLEQTISGFQVSWQDSCGLHFFFLNLDMSCGGFMLDCFLALLFWQKKLPSE